MQAYHTYGKLSMSASKTDFPFLSHYSNKDFIESDNCWTICYKSDMAELRCFTETNHMVSKQS